MDQDCLTTHVSGAVATVTLNRPGAANALDAELRARLRAQVGRINDMPDVRAVILRGAGKAFCAGADIRGGLPDPVVGHIDIEYKPFLTGIARSDKIWIAQVQGTAAGIGAALAMTCDLITMSEDACIYMAFAAIGLVPDGGNTRHLLDHLGYHRALEVILEGQRLTAEECKTCGIANRVFPSDQLEAETTAWAERLTQSAPLALSATKRLLRTVGSGSLGDAISLEGDVQAPLLKSADFHEGVSAFFAKRKPEWTGR